MKNIYPASLTSALTLASIAVSTALISTQSTAKQDDRYAPSTRIVGGVEAIPDAWPFMSAIVATFEAVDTDLTVDNVNIESESFTNGASGEATGELASCGLGGEVCTDVEDKICLIERGEFNFSEKALNCENGGGVGAIIYNNVEGQISGTMGDDFNGTIPVVAITQEEGQALLEQIGATTFVSVAPTSELQQDSTCGASFLGERWVLTAAHCVDSAFSNQLKVNVGEFDLTDGAEEAIDIANIFIHPGYEDGNFENDVAILQLAQPANAPVVELADAAFTDQVADENRAATVIGWGGRTGYEPGAGPTGDFPDTLQEVELNLLNNAQCTSTMINAGVLEGSVGVTDVMICATFTGGGRGSCQGDSGGPLLVEDGEALKQVGIVSWGRGCAADGFPGVYARVGALRDFIDSATTGIALANPTSFAPVPVGFESTATFTVINGSDQTLTPVFSSADSVDGFTIDASNCSDMAPGATCSLNMSFVPSVGGLNTATINADSSDPEIMARGASVSMSAIGAADELADLAGTPTEEVSWFSGGDLPWVANDAEGATGIKTGAIEDLQESTLMATIEGEGTLTFEWSISSEENTEDPEDPFDAMFLLVNGEQQQFISGEVAFTEVSIELGEGTNLIEWTYRKDLNTQSGEDEGYLRSVTFAAPAPPPPPPPAPTPTPPVVVSNDSGGGALGWLSMMLVGLAFFRRKA